MISIYTDKETALMLETLKNQNPDFNISAFFKTAISEHIGGNVEEKMLINKIQTAKMKKDQVDAELTFLGGQLEKLKLAEQLKVAEEERIEKEERDNARYKEYLEEVSKFVLENHEEYLKGIKDGKWISNRDFYDKKKKEVRK